MLRLRLDTTYEELKQVILQACISDYFIGLDTTYKELKQFYYKVAIDTSKIRYYL